MMSKHGIWAYCTQKCSDKPTCFDDDDDDDDGYQWLVYNGYIMVINGY